MRGRWRAGGWFWSRGFSLLPFLSWVSGYYIIYLTNRGEERVWWLEVVVEVVCLGVGA